jgi:hypothetical protein
MPEIELTQLSLLEILGAQALADEYGRYQIPEYQGFIDELQSTGLAIQEDPGGEPLSTLNLKIAQIDAQKTRVATIYTMAIANENEFEILACKVNMLFKREFDRQLPKEPVRGLSNKELREAACNSILQELKDLVDAINGSLMQAKSFSKIVATTLAKLDSTNKNISRQITVLQLQQGIGEIQRQSQNNPHTFT